MNSIRRKLLLWQISALVLTGLLVSLISYALAWNAFNRVRDYGLEQIAYSILRHGVVSASGEQGDDEDKGQFVSQIWDAQEGLVYSSLPDVGPPPQKDGLNDIVWRGERWHTYTLRSGNLTIQVGNTTINRTRTFARATPWVLLPLSVLLLVLGGFIWVAVGRALAPLERMRREIGERDAASLHALDTRDLPEEIAPLAATLNELLARLDAALVSQRRFIADAAHELRSPLTAVKLQAQIARQARNPAEWEAAMNQLLAGVDRTTHLVEQLLNMARLAPEASRQPPVPVRLDELAKRVVGDFSAQAMDRRIDLGVGHCVSVTVQGQAEDLRVMLGNLVDNALRYIPTGGRVDVEVHAHQGSAVLTVVDNGPGIPAEERERAFDRFHRLSGADVTGSGLGLSIVKEIVRLHHGRIDLLDTPGGGLTVRVELPV